MRASALGSWQKRRAVIVQNRFPMTGTQFEMKGQGSLIVAPYRQMQVVVTKPTG